MAGVTFSPETEQFIGLLMEELDPAKRFAGLLIRDRMPADEWDFLVGRERRVLRAQIEAALVVAAIGIRDEKRHELQTLLLDSHGFGLGDELPDALRAVGIYDTLPNEIVCEFEDAYGCMYDEAVERVWHRPSPSVIILT